VAVALRWWQQWRHAPVLPVLPMRPAWAVLPVADR